MTGLAESSKRMKAHKNYSFSKLHRMLFKTMIKEKTRLERKNSRRSRRKKPMDEWKILEEQIDTEIKTLTNKSEQTENETSIKFKMLKCLTAAYKWLFKMFIIFHLS